MSGGSPAGSPILTVATMGRGFYDVTAEVQARVVLSGVERGLCNVFLQHTSASLLISENADVSVRRDLQTWLDELAPEGDDYEHDDEGPDDMPAHLRAALLRTSETVPVIGGKLALGTWQAIYVVEHRRRAHARRVVITIVGGSG